MSDRPIVRDIRRFLVVWVGVVLVGTGLLFLTSEGEPVCEGPLIIDVDDSDPPQCNTLTEGLREHGGMWLLSSVILAALARVAWVGAAVVIGRFAGTTAPLKDQRP